VIHRRAFLGGLLGAAAGCAAGNRRPLEEARIWDLHCHLREDGATPPEELMTRTLGYADRMGIERLIFLSFGHKDSSPQDVVKVNDRYLRGLEKRHPRALGFVFVNPNHVENGLRELDRCVRDGPMVGVKLHVSLRCDAPQLDPILRRAAELKAVVYQHTWMKTPGNEPGESSPADVVELSARHPDAALICGHSGGNWELGVRTLRKHRRIPMAVEGFDPAAGVVEMAVRELGAERVLYGSDVSGRSFASQLAKVVGADIPDDARRLILGGNLRRLLGPILRAKGIPS
jgi:predicted TIM-barrel fold metal-dependent hydrolase